MFFQLSSLEVSPKYYSIESAIWILSINSPTPKLDHKMKIAKTVSPNFGIRQPNFFSIANRMGG